MLKTAVSRAIAMAAGAAIVIAGGPAAASSTPPGPAHEGPGGGGAVPSALASPAALQRSSQFAGYQYQGGGELVSPVTVTATVVVPPVTCGGATRAVDPNVGIYRQPSKVFISAGLFLGCSRGAAHVWPALTVKGTYKTRTFSKVPVHPGDVVVLTAVLSPQQAKVSVVDETRHVSRRLSGATSSGWSGPYIGTSGWDTATHRLLAVPSFGTLRFERCLLQRTGLGRLQSTAAYERVSSAGTVQIAVSPFSHGGRAFSDLFRHP